MTLVRAVAVLALILAGCRSSTVALSERDFIASRGHGDCCWQPTPAQALEAKAAVLKALATPNGKVQGMSESARKMIDATIDDYYLQYIGTWEFPEGEQPTNPTVIVHGVCRLKPGWLAQMRAGVMVASERDPGPCYFDAAYTLTSMRVAINLHGMPADQ